MAMFNFNYKLLSSLNSFNQLEKDRYLSYMDKTPKRITGNKSSLSFTVLKDFSFSPNKKQ
jgi:hypothetical protein